MSQTLTSRVGVSLRNLLPGAKFFGASDILAKGCCARPEHVLPGEIFMAICDDDQDGHDHVEDAIRRGAAAVVSEKPLPVSVPVCVVSDSREAYGQLCHALADQPSDRIKVIGVTGTNGKTTTCLLIKAILQKAGAKVGSLTSLGFDNGYDEQSWSHPTPNPAIMADLLSRMQYNGCTHAVIEASSEGLVKQHLAGIQLDVAAFTNIRQNHIELHGSARNYYRAKKKLLKYLRDTGVAIFNGDDSNCTRLMNQSEVPSLSIAVHGVGEITATVVERHKSEQTFLLTAGSQTMPVCTRMIGDHHVYNCLVAAAVCLVYGVDMKTVVRGLESVETLPGRMQRIECGQSFGVFVDQAHTHDGLAVALKTLRRVTHGRLICVLGAHESSDKINRPLLGRVAERGSDVSLITLSGSYGQMQNEVVHDIVDGFARPAKAHVVANRKEAIRYALSQAEIGDTVLITGQTTERLVSDRVEQSDPRDCDVARELLYEMVQDEDHSMPEAKVIAFPR
ncbi:UDP-N-acetylmuramyl-tripeptide synthetase [Bremerella sp. JC817]|uniref:Mur ligase family protein n=1 Tax=Bremerella sp. JC817 TaxID=3231756 RepID=UPI00345A3442